jgi:hypothetical protein
MAKSKPRKKVRPKIPKGAGARKKRLMVPPVKAKKSLMIVGFDISMSSIAGAAIAYDRMFKEFKGPAFVSHRWQKDTHYFDRILNSGLGANFILNLQAELKGVFCELEDVWIAVEEPWPLGMVKQMESHTLKQQAEISGAFLLGLLRWGFKNVFQINSIQWRKIVADDLGITTHHSKWRDPSLCKTFNCNPRDSGKFRSKQWALMHARYDVPDWPDIIESKNGKIPRPENSQAKAMQPDDCYDALAIMEWMRQEYEGLNGPMEKFA